MNLILSIKPEYANRIFDKTKQVEFRKTIFTKQVDNVYVYSTAPDKKIIGYFKIRKIVKDTPACLWKKYKTVAGISEKKFFKYFENTMQGYAMEIAIPQRFTAPIDGTALKQNFKPPQSFTYVKRELQTIKNRIVMKSTLERDKLLKEIYPNTPNKVIAVKLGMSLASVSKRAYVLGLKKAPNYRNPGCFQKGNIPSNKGKKMLPETYAKLKKTMFKKGLKPHNTKPIKSKRTSKDGYIEIKVAEPNIWDFKHRIVWRKHYGEIPKGANIQFKDKNPQNCNIDNLYLIFRSEQMLNNSIQRYPPELRKAIRLLSKLNKKINKNDEKNKHRSAK